MSLRWPRLLTPTHLSQLIRSQKNPLKALDIFNEARVKYPSYRHNGPVYATMIRILGSSGRIAEMQELINQMKDDSCQCQDSLFAGAIRTYTDAGLLEEAVSLYKSLPEFNCVNFTESFNTLLEIMVQESKLEACHQLFVENFHGREIKWRTHSLNLLMDALCRVNRSDLALHVFREMDSQWSYPDRETYKTLMRGLCQDGRLTEATDLLYSMFWTLSPKGCGADVSIHRILLEALCDNGEIDEALKVLEFILRKGLKVPKRYLKQLDLDQLHYKNNASTEHIKALINEALIRGTIPSSDGYTTMIIDLYTEGRIAEGDNLIKEMHMKGFKASSPIYEAKIAALYTSGEVDKAIDVVEREMIENSCVPTSRLHKIVIKGLCDAKELDRAIWHFEKMSMQVGCVPDRDTYICLVDGLCCNGKYMEASQMLEKMLINSFWPEDDYLYTKLIHGLCSIGKPYKAVMWLEEMISEAKIPQVSVWHSLVSSLCGKKGDRMKLLVALMELQDS